MSGFSPKKAIKLGFGGVRSESTQEDCDLEFRIDLVGVRADVSKVLSEGDVLEIALLAESHVRSVVCRKGNSVVGTLAAFRGLAQLIACLSEGHKFVAHVEVASSTRCAVIVRRL